MTTETHHDSTKAMIADHTPPLVEAVTSNEVKPSQGVFVNELICRDESLHLAFNLAMHQHGRGISETAATTPDIQREFYEEPEVGASSQDSGEDEEIDEEILALKQKIIEAVDALPIPIILECSHSDHLVYTYIRYGVELIIQLQIELNRVSFEIFEGYGNLVDEYLIPANVSMILDRINFEVDQIDFHRAIRFHVGWEPLARTGTAFLLSTRESWWELTVTVNSRVRLTELSERGTPMSPMLEIDMGSLSENLKQARRHITSK